MAPKLAEAAVQAMGPACDLAPSNGAYYGPTALGSTLGKDAEYDRWRSNRISHLRDVLSGRKSDKGEYPENDDRRDRQMRHYDSLRSLSNSGRHHLYCDARDRAEHERRMVRYREELEMLLGEGLKSVLGMS